MLISFLTCGSNWVLELTLETVPLVLIKRCTACKLSNSAPPLSCVTEAAAAERGRGHSYVLMCMRCGWGHDNGIVYEHHILFGVPLSVCSVSYRIITSTMNEKMENLIPLGGGGGGK